MWNYMCIRWLINWSDSTKIHGATIRFINWSDSTKMHGATIRFINWSDSTKMHGATIRSIIIAVSLFLKLISFFCFLRSLTYTAVCCGRKLP